MVPLLSHSPWAIIKDGFICWNFLLFLRPKKTIKNSSGQIWQLCAYIANESTLKAIQFSTLFIYLFIYLFIRDVTKTPGLGERGNETY